MVSYCAAIGCKNRFIKGSGLAFHGFPLKNKIMLMKWLKEVRRKNFVPTTSSVLCSAHFTSDCYFPRTRLFPHTVKTKKLKATAIPTLFSFNNGVNITNKDLLQKQDTTDQSNINSKVSASINLQKKKKKHAQPETVCSEKLKWNSAKRKENT